MTQEGPRVMKLDMDISVANDRCGAPGEPGLRAGALSLRQTVFFGLTGLGLANLLSSSGAFFAFSARYWAWLAILIGTVCFVPLVATVVVFARRQVATGSLVSYLDIEAGRKTGALGAASLFVGYAGALGFYLVSSLLFGLSFANDIGLGTGDRLVQVIAAAVLTIVAVMLARRGISMSVNVAIGLGAIGLPIVILAIGSALYQTGLELEPQFDFTGITLTSLFGGVVISIGNYAGFEGLTALARETRDPIGTIPKVVTILVTVIGIAALISVLLTVPIMVRHVDALDHGSSPLAVLLNVGGLGKVNALSDAALFAASSGGLLAYLNDAARVIATTGRDGLMHPAIARIHPIYRTPSVALSAMGAVALVAFALFALISERGLFGVTVSFITLQTYSWLVAYIALAATGARFAFRHRRLWLAFSCIGSAISLSAMMIYQLVQDAGSRLPWLALAIVFLLWLAGVARLRGRGIDTLPVTAKSEVL